MTNIFFDLQVIYLLPIQLLYKVIFITNLPMISYLKIN